VNGVMVEGVVVDKQKTRQVFEAEVRKGVDPGLVEQVAGAAYRTRVFPIPAGGSRTVRVSYVSELESGPEVDALLPSCITPGPSTKLQHFPQIMADLIGPAHSHRCRQADPGAGGRRTRPGRTGVRCLVRSLCCRDHLEGRFSRPPGGGGSAGLGPEPDRGRARPDGTVYFSIHDTVTPPRRIARIELLALVELNNMLPKPQRLGTAPIPLDPRLIQPLDMDIRVVMSWDADLTDMDLHVIEPSGEEAYYGNNRTQIGGRVSRDFTRGYGPEEYAIRTARQGTYTIRTKFFGSSAAKLQGAVTLYLDLYTDYGRPTERRQSITIRLVENKETFTIGEITIGGGGRVTTTPR
jgi:hypothetical protein